MDKTTEEEVNAGKTEKTTDEEEEVKEGKTEKTTEEEVEELNSANSEKATDEGEAEEEEEEEEGRLRKDSAEVNHKTAHRDSGKTLKIMIARIVEIMSCNHFRVYTS